jgi:hypothetical protein
MVTDKFPAATSAFLTLGTEKEMSAHGIETAAGGNYYRIKFPTSSNVSQKKTNGP